MKIYIGIIEKKKYNWQGNDKLNIYIRDNLIRQNPWSIILLTTDKNYCDAESYLRGSYSACWKYRTSVHTHIQV